ncbi:hypothetical protein Palpr_1904 [Paludibacter propionicigenes WB4]|uniref:Uncharacterized protein n=1 Tax=Paludibacter propionicigenes (strain DSM 17365 / JCM 13257 / WB4) TaxID=694427 RepID=E4T5P9_PALPW|nr:hypothetical protein [Paludibacter propionicigenes]ADQ80043.1 hypothetical protein Palpr_1904 [Paludibacter propionicigenes WB4]
MKHKINLLLPFICFFLISCSSTPSPELKIAERLIESNPDSALKILQNIEPQSIKSDYNRALYGLLKIEAIDNNHILLTPDSALDFSMAYYKKKNDQQHLAVSYFYKARIYRYMQKDDKAIVLYLSALDYFLENNNYKFLSMIYSNIGDICLGQADYYRGVLNYKLALECAKHTGENINYKIVFLGNAYRRMKNYKTAMKYYQKAKILPNDSILYGIKMQEMGLNFYFSENLDSAQYYIRKSIKYPSRKNAYATKYYALSDLLFDLAKYDSASYYAKVALSYPHNFYTQRECYRILTNVEYLRKDITQMNKYMEQYKSSSDSVRKIEAQPKFKVLESLHYADLKAKKAKREMTLFVVVLLISVLLSGLLVHALYKRNKQKKRQLNIVKDELNQKQQHVSKSLFKKIEENRAAHIVKQKKSKPELVKLIYKNTLHLDNWQEFKIEMNHTFNQIIDKLEEEYPEITQRELIWCCLQLLEIPNADRIDILDTTSGGLYKLKQRLAKKIKLKSTKELDEFLKNMISL